MSNIDEVAKTLYGEIQCPQLTDEEYEDTLREAARALHAAGLLVPDGLRWDYAVEVRPDEDSEWQHTGPWWDTIEKARSWRGTATVRIGWPYPHDRLVRRLVGELEEVGSPPRSLEGHN